MPWPIFVSKLLFLDSILLTRWDMFIFIAVTCWAYLTPVNSFLGMLRLLTCILSMRLGSCTHYLITMLITQPVLRSCAFGGLSFDWFMLWYDAGSVVKVSIYMLVISYIACLWSFLWSVIPLYRGNVAKIFYFQIIRFSCKVGCYSLVSELRL